MNGSNGDQGLPNKDGKIKKVKLTNGTVKSATQSDKKKAKHLPKKDNGTVKGK